MDISPLSGLYNLSMCHFSALFHPVGDIVANGAVEECRFLADKADLMSHRSDIQIPGVVLVEKLLM